MKQSAGKFCRTTIFLLAGFGLGSSHRVFAVSCDSFVCNPPTATILFTPGFANTTLQEISVHDVTANVDYPPIFFANPAGTTFPGTYGHTLTATVNVQNSGIWYPAVCVGGAVCGPGLPGNFTCGGTPLSICGKVLAAEDQTTRIEGILVELRDSLGRRIGLQTTNNSLPGNSYNYKFSGLPSLIYGPYFVDLVVDRSEYASPAQQEVQVPDPISPSFTLPASVDFYIGGSTVGFKVSDDSGTLVMMTTFTWTAANPPDINRSAPPIADFYTGVTNINGDALFSLPCNHTYFVTCWRMTQGAGGLSYVKTGTAPNGAGILAPIGGPVGGGSIANIRCP